MIRNNTSVLIEMHKFILKLKNIFGILVISNSHIAMTKEIWREKCLRANNELTSMELQKNYKIILAKNGSVWTMVDFVNFQFGEFLFGLDYLYYKDE